MPTIMTHGLVALALAASRRARASTGVIGADRKRVLLASALCAVLPDIDYLGYKAGIQYDSLFGHRGFTHSFLFAALVALVVASLFHHRARRSPAGSPAGSLASWLRLSALFFVATSSHAALDALTDGGEGVALLSPFSNHRYFFPYRPIMVSPLGVVAFFKSWRGLLVVLDEIAFILVPLAVLLYGVELRALARRHRLAAVGAVVSWMLMLSLLTGLSPLNNWSLPSGHEPSPVIDLYAKQYSNVEVLKEIPTAGIFGGALITQFSELESRDLFGRRLETQNIDKHWSSGFFASWFGGIAGRWQDPDYQLLLRSFFGFGTPDFRGIRTVLAESAQSRDKAQLVFGLSPSEKYDLALGDYGFSATQSVLSTSHNSESLPKFWNGICNGMAAAAKGYDEPFRIVDVINPNGFKIRFHPNDVKALLGYALAEVSLWNRVGVLCAANGPEADGCRVNAGAFFLATLNRIGLAKDAFIVDGFSGARKQFYLFDAVRVDVLKPPTPIAAGWVGPSAVKQIAEVQFSMELVSTLLSDKTGGHADEAKGPDFYRKVGRVVVPRVLRAAIALGDGGEVVGGAWLGEADVPDILYFFGPEPATDRAGRLRTNPHFAWPFIEKLYRQSVNDAAEVSPIDHSL